ncbi:hypothetical protein [Kribbella sp. CA-293567]|uniref:hypothetical protein n=1 Tax=Kribbella sp. CA-293567 TaxID=3002436 RepID=UPI0022DDB3F7|nr:hypothetical protein [Kribbella sp. CA-293567]WBQ07739.1 hypothetical protein OX958_13275 [Kribbella sp. CA-293567]
MDDVKKLLAEFADRSVDGIPPADVDADVARGRRALRRIRARRRVTGVLCIAAATTAVLALGQLKWWGGDQSQVAGGAGEAAPASVTGSATKPVATPSVQDSDGEIELYSGPAVSLVTNREAWNSITCSLTPQGWTPQQPVGTDHVLLAPPTMRTGDLGENDGLELRAEPQALSLTATRVTSAGGKVFHLGQTGGRETGQVLLGERWLLVQLPAGNLDWNDDLLRRFMASCSVN